MSASMPVDDASGGVDGHSIGSNSGSSDSDSLGGQDDADVDEMGASTSSGENHGDLPEPRQHAYLPGASHPLYPEGWIGRSGVGRPCQHGPAAASSSSPSSTPHASTQSSLYDPIPPTILAPNSTIIELPILELDDVILFPGCTVPLRLRHPGWVEYLGRRIDEARFGFGVSSSGDVFAGGDISDQQQVRIGVMIKLRGTRRRTRSHQPLNEAPTARDDGNTAGDAAASTGRATRATSRRQGRWRMESLRRGVIRQREPEQDNHEQAAGVGDRNDGGGGRSNDNNGPTFIRPTPPADPRIGRIGTLATITYTHEAAAESEPTAANDEVVDNGDGAGASYRSRVWLRHSGQLVMTAMGTARFRILSRIDSGSTTLDAEQRVYPELFRGDMADIKLYAVEVMVDENLPLPPMRPLMRRKFTNCGMIETLSWVTPAPSFVYNAHWPCKIVEEICKQLSAIPAWQGLWKSLPPSSGIEQDISSDNENFVYTPNTTDPLAFAFWMASNMPLSDADRLDLLEMHCNVERLRLILVKVAQQRQLERPIRCKQCGETITTLSSLFTVGGAEGTTGAYVNEYGIVHQTQTVRTVDADHVFCVGNRESRDSWFHGYTWTIMHCATCGAHIGWKFDAIRGQVPVGRNDDCPNRFFGLTGGSVTIEERSAPRRATAGRLMMNVILQGMAAEDDRADSSNGRSESGEEGDGEVEAHSD